MWDYGSGDMVANGVHLFDIARWGLQKEEYPVKVSSKGGYFAFESDQETPNTQSAIFEYADGTILQGDVRGVYTNKEDDLKIGNFFYGTKGWMHINAFGNKWKTFYGWDNEPGPTSESAEEGADPMNLTGSGDAAHLQNFLDVIRSGKHEDLACDIVTGHKSAVIGHIANISYRTGRELRIDGNKCRFVDDSKANKFIRRKDRKPYIVPNKV